jgi:branched-chain amino acid transport system substrate-binding protein
VNIKHQYLVRLGLVLAIKVWYCVGSWLEAGREARENTGSSSRKGVVATPCAVEERTSLMLSARMTLGWLAGGLLSLGLLGCDKKEAAPAANTAATTPAKPEAAKTEAAKPESAKSESAPAAAPSGKAIVIGHFGSLTGSEATFGQSTSNGIRLAIKEVNAKGGVLGKPIELKEYDTRGDAGEAKLAVERLVKSDKVTAVLGEVASKLSLAAGPVCQEAGVPMITPSSTNPKVTEIGDYIFRVCFIDPFQGLAGAKFARENLKAGKAAVLVDQAQAYAVGLAEQFELNFTRMGGTIATKQNYTGGAQDFTSQLTSIRSAGADVIYIPGYYTDVGNIAIQARRLGITKPMLGGDGWDSDQLAKIAGDAIGVPEATAYLVSGPYDLVKSPDINLAIFNDLSRVICFQALVKRIPNFLTLETRLLLVTVMVLEVLLDSWGM